MVLRLARFNVMMDDPNRPEWQKDFFTGHAGARGRGHVAAAALPVLPRRADGPTPAPVVLVYLLGLAFLMVLDDPGLFGQDHRQIRAAPLGAADLRAVGGGVRPSGQLSVRGADGHHA